MQTQLRTEPLGIVILALAFGTIGLSACNDGPADIATIETKTFIGTPPAAPTVGGETPTPVDKTVASPSGPAGKESSLAKDQESTKMPMPGQANDHSTLAPNASQKADPAPAKAPR